MHGEIIVVAVVILWLTSQWVNNCSVSSKDTRALSMEVVVLFLLFFDRSYICLTQETCTCSRSIIETLEKGVKYAKS